MKLIHFKPKWSFPKFNEENRMVNIMDIYIFQWNIFDKLK